jgi:PBSX family phage portal protein
MIDNSGMRVTRDTSPDSVEIEIGTKSYSQDDLELDINEKLVNKSDDPFAKSLTQVRKLSGLSPATKRKMSRDIKKLADGDNKPLATGDGNARSKARTDQFATGYGAFDVVEPPYNLDYLAKLYELSPAHMAAVDAKVTNTVGLGHSFVESSTTQEKLSRIEKEEDRERARRRVARAMRTLDDWLETLNSEDTFIETLRKVMVDYETIGNAYIEIGRITDVDKDSPMYGQIGYIGHLHATTMRRRVRKDGYVQLVAGRATFFRNYGSTTADPIGDDPNPNEVIHLSKYTPTNSYYGVPDILSARNAVAGEEFSSRFNLDYFEHKAVPRYIVIIKNAKLSAQAEQRLIDFLQSNLKGQHHRTLYIPLPSDGSEKPVEFKLEPVEAKITDASFTKYKEANRDEVFMAHRTPLPQVGATANISLGASRDSARMFKEQVCRPVQEIIEKRLRPVFRERTNAFEFHLTELTLTDEETASRIHERYLRWDVQDPNEIREWLGKKGRKDGDDTVGMMSQAKLKSSMGPTGQVANQTRTRDAERSGGPDSVASDRSRNTAGDGRQTE